MRASLPFAWLSDKETVFLLSTDGGMYRPENCVGIFFVNHNPIYREVKKLPPRWFRPTQPSGLFSFPLTM
jgi:hypothetical protein